MKFSAYVFFIIGFCTCGARAQTLPFTVTNNLDFERTEVVALPVDQLGDYTMLGYPDYTKIQNAATRHNQPVQWIDYDADGTPDELLFQATVTAKATASYVVSRGNKPAEEPQAPAAFSRFVPERADDYTWENDRVAFRVYGPAGQKEALAGVPGSTLGSGVDIWLKRVKYPVINKWYAGHVKAPGFYHTDRGEGYDPYHVGGSRGTGGTGVWVNDSLQVSENFVSYKTIATGPLRTVFELTYAPWSEYGITETKRITLDVGTNFSKFEVRLTSQKKIPNYAVGITLHRNGNAANISINKKQGSISHWEKIDDAFVGEGIVINPKSISRAFSHVTTAADQSNLLILVKPKEFITYYAGFAWQKSGQVQSVTDFDELLNKQAQLISNPLIVNLKKDK
jgi:hypothetical protein